MHGLIGTGATRQARRPRRNLQYSNATWRAYVAAMSNLGVPITTCSVQDAVTKFGSNPAYVTAMKVLIESEEKYLIDGVLAGRVSLLAAAAHVRKRTKLVKTYQASDAEARKALGEGVGVDNIWDEVIAPAL